MKNELQIYSHLITHTYLRSLMEEDAPPRFRVGTPPPRPAPDPPQRARDLTDAEWEARQAHLVQKDNEFMSRVDAWKSWARKHRRYHSKNKFPSAEVHAMGQAGSKWDEAYWTWDMWKHMPLEDPSEMIGDDLNPGVGGSVRHGLAQIDPGLFVGAEMLTGADQNE